MVMPTLQPLNMQCQQRTYLETSDSEGQFEDFSAALEGLPNARREKKFNGPPPPPPEVPPGDPIPCILPLSR